MSTSLDWQMMLDKAVAEYTSKIGVDLTQHEIANQLQSCRSPDDVLKLLEDKANQFKDYREKNHIKLVGCLAPVVRVTHTFSNVLDKAISLTPFQPAGLIFAGVDILLTAASDVTSSYDALIELFECVGCFLKRLEIYSNIPSSDLMNEIIVKIMVELLSVLALATEQIKNGLFKKFAKKLLGEREIEAALQRLDRLTREEGQMTMTQTLEVVHSLMNNVTRVMKDGKVTMGGVLNALISMQQIVDDLSKKKNVKSRCWLSPPDPSRNYNTARGLYLDGTTMWFFREGHFDKWKACPSLLWIYGKPGSGKSILISSIIAEIDHVRRAGLAWMAYFFFDFRDVKKQHRHTLLSSLICQLSDLSDPCCHILSCLYSAHDEGHSEPSDAALLQCLTDMLEVPERPATYIMIDALDESPDVSGMPAEREKVLDFLEALVRLRLPDVYICVSSRFESDIRKALKPLLLFSVSLHDEPGQKEDISTYIEATVNSDRKMQAWTEQDKKLVIDTLSAKSDGMYRWVYCQLDNLRRGFPASIRNALEQLPESLDEVYKHALLRIDKARRKFARRLFECLAVAARPLRVEELADILEVPFDKGQVSESNTLSGAEEAVLFACSSLITIVDAAGGSRVVQFFHFSVEEFLTSDRLAEEGPDLSYYHVTPQRANTTFAKTCLRVLLTLDKQINREGIKDFPLAHYASRHWFDHCLRLEDMPKDLHRDTLLLFNRNEPHFSAWVWLYDMDDPSEKTMSTGYPEQPKAVPLYYAVRGGFRWLVEGLASAHPEDVNDRGGYFETPLFAAFAMEDDKSAASLLRCRADPNVLNNDGASILHYASQSGDVGFVWLLLKHNADVNLPNAEGQTPLGLSSVGGHLEVCRLLVQRDAKVDARDHNGRTPLGLSSVGGHLEVCRLLVQRDAKVDARDHNGRTPLWIASHLGYLDVVLYLIDNCADVNSADNDGWSPLQSARSQCHPDVVQLLLDRGAVLELCKPHENIPPNSSANPESGNREYELTNFTPERITGSLDGAANPSNSEEETSSSDVAQQPQTLREETKTTIDERPADTVFGDGQLDMVLFISCLFIFIAFLWAESSSLN